MSERASPHRFSFHTRARLDSSVDQERAPFFGTAREEEEEKKLSELGRFGTSGSGIAYDVSSNSNTAAQFNAPASEDGGAGAGELNSCASFGSAFQPMIVHDDSMMNIIGQTPPAKESL